MTKDELIAEAVAAKCDAADLDELVHDLKCGEASDENNGAPDDSRDEERIGRKEAEAGGINNGGLSRQIEYVVESCGEKDAEKQIRNALSLGVRCSACKAWCNPKTAHLHQGEWICDESCWIEQLRSSE